MHRLLSIVAITLVAGAINSGAAADQGPVNIGVMNDMTGAYSDAAGPGSVEAARMAVEDFGGEVLGHPIELVSADHQNRADLASTLAREWFDAANVDAIFDVPNSAAALGIQELAREREKFFFISGAATTRLTGDACSPTSVHWTYDTHALATGTARAVVEEGGDTWFFLTADYAFGHALEEDVSRTVREMGGEVVGSVRHPLNTTDFSSFLLQAQASGAKIVALANAATDTTNSILQSAEFGIVAGGQQLAGLLLLIQDIHAVGLEMAQGLYLTTGFYWDLDDDTRAWSQRFYERRGHMPSMVQAGVYSSVLHFLRAVDAAGTKEPDAVMAKVREMPVEDFFAQGGYVREDGRMVHDMYLARVKAPEESKYPWDYYEIVRVIPGEQAFRPMEDGGCPYVN
jgi:branched-chain amino acid transport system substrate-binding protein